MSCWFQDTSCVKNRGWWQSTPIDMTCIGQPVAWKLAPANTQTLLGLPGSATMTRAGFASKSLWVTPYRPDERWVGGKYPLQNPHPGGILEWTRQVRVSFLIAQLPTTVYSSKLGYKRLCLMHMRTKFVLYNVKMLLPIIYKWLNLVWLIAGACTNAINHR